MTGDRLGVPVELRPVSMNVHRCYECGRCWALEMFAATNGSCPCCSQRRITALDALIATNNRVINALRGVARRKGARHGH